MSVSRISVAWASLAVLLAGPVASQTYPGGNWGSGGDDDYPDGRYERGSPNRNYSPYGVPGIPGVPSAPGYPAPDGGNIPNAGNVYEMLRDMRNQGRTQYQPPMRSSAGQYRPQGSAVGGSSSNAGSSLWNTANMRPYKTRNDCNADAQMKARVGSAAQWSNYCANRFKGSQQLATGTGSSATESNGTRPSQATTTQSQNRQTSNTPAPVREATASIDQDVHKQALSDAQAAARDAALAAERAVNESTGDTPRTASSANAASSSTRPTSAPKINSPAPEMKAKSLWKSRSTYAGLYSSPTDTNAVNSLSPGTCAVATGVTSGSMAQLRVTAAAGNEQRILWARAADLAPATRESSEHCVIKEF